ncbi:MAG: outer membrane protein assembly factor BamA [Fibrobacterota bacterium]
MIILKMNLNCKLFAFLLLTCVIWAFSQETLPIVNDVIVKGNTSVSRTLIKDHLYLKRGDLYSREKLRESIKSLYDLGLFRDIRVEGLSAGENSVDLVVIVDEYPLLESVEFSGNRKVDSDKLSEIVDLIDGQALTDYDIERNKNAILDHYRGEGLLTASIETKQYESKESGKTVLEYAIEEGKKVQVEKINITGAGAFDPSEIKKTMETKEDRWWRSGDFDAAVFASDIDSVRKFYRDRGFLDVKINDSEVEYSEDGRGITVTIDLTEGRRYFMGEIDFEGNELFESDKLRRLLPDGEEEGVYSESAMQKVHGQLMEVYREEGYLNMYAEPVKSFRGDTVDLTFRIIEKSPAYVKRVRIKGNTKTVEKVIRREMHVDPGEIYKQSLMARSIRDIYHLNYFDNVIPDISQNPDGSVDLIVEVEEKSSGTGKFSMGAGWSERDKFVGTLGLQIPNFSVRRPFVEGAGQMLDLNVEYGKFKKTYDVGFTEPYFLDTPTLIGFRGYWNWRQWEDDSLSPETIQYGVNLTLGRALSWPDDYFSFTARYSWSYLETAYPNKEERPEDDPEDPTLDAGRERSLTLTLKRDDTDMPLFPSRGSVYRYSLNITGGPFGGDYSFLRHDLKSEWYAPIFWKFVLGTKATFGLMESFNDKLVPQYSDYYRAGGVNYSGVIRGYPDWSLGGYWNNGTSMLVLSADISFPIVEQTLYMSVFNDFGNTFRGVEDIDLNKLYAGTGAGVRLNVPMIGVIGMDFAYGFDRIMNRYGYEEDPGWEFHFMFGRGF